MIDADVFVYALEGWHQHRAASMQRFLKFHTASPFCNLSMNAIRELVPFVIRVQHYFESLARLNRFRNAATELDTSMASSKVFFTDVDAASEITAVLGIAARKADAALVIHQGDAEIAVDMCKPVNRERPSTCRVLQVFPGCVIAGREAGYGCAFPHTISVIRAATTSCFVVPAAALQRLTRLDCTPSRPAPSVSLFSCAKMARRVDDKVTKIETNPDRMIRAKPDLQFAVVGSLQDVEIKERCQDGNDVDAIIDHGGETRRQAFRSLKHKFTADCI